MCPSPLTCSPDTRTCESTGALLDAALHDGLLGDGPTDGQPLGDAANLPDFAELSGQQWLMPCDSAPTPTLCPTHDVSHMVVVGGHATTTYTATVRIRGVMERGTYSGGMAQGAWYVGGMTTSTFLTVAELDVSSPAQRYFLNNVPSGSEQTFDYQATLPIAGGATVTMSMSALDGQAVATSTTVIPGVTTTPSPYVGQFAQIDVVGVTGP